MPPMKAKEVIEELSISRPMLSKLVKQGVIRAEKKENVYHYNEEDVRNYNGKNKKKKHIVEEVNRFMESIEDNHKEVVAMAKNSLMANLAKGDASLTKMVLQNQSSEFKTLEQKLQDHIIIHKPEW